MDLVANITSPKGELIMNYVELLKKEMEEQGKSDEYISLCVDYAQVLCNNNVPVIFDFTHLALLLGIDPPLVSYYLFANEEEFYRTYSIPKKAGGYREIDVPSNRLKGVQRWVLQNILSKVKVHDKCFGFMGGKSIYSNALNHVGKECVLNLDLKDFFPSITIKDVFFIFYNLGYTKKVSYYLAKLMTKGGVLPQGSPASPMISNIVGMRLDKRLDKLANTYGAFYSRYADDITFSGSSSIIKMLPTVEKIIKEEGFLVNEKKTRYAFSYQRQEVTGLIVNKKVSVPKSYIKEFKKEIYYCSKYGVASHLKRIDNRKSFFKEYMYGKAYFINMVDQLLGKKLINQLDEIDWDY